MSADDGRLKLSGAASDALRAAIDTYGQSLTVAGGRQQQALIRIDNHAHVGAALYASPAFDLVVPPLSVARLSVNLTSARVIGGLDGERESSFDTNRYSMFLAPAGAPARWRKTSPSRHVTVYFHPEALGQDEFVAGPVPLMGPLFNVRVPGIQTLVDQLITELESTRMLSIEAADSLARLLLVRVSRHVEGRVIAAIPLAEQRVGRLRDYVLAHLAGPIMVADLAREVAMPPNRFAVSLREQTGRSPHQFVLQVRLEHACNLLRHSDQSLATVAHVCGFSNQQHLTNAMRRRMSVTPSRYRNAHGADRADQADRTNGADGKDGTDATDGTLAIGVNA